MPPVSQRAWETGMKALFRNLVMVVAGFVFALFLAEVALRALNLYEPPRLRPARPDLYQPDEHVGYRLWLSTHTCDRYPPDNPEVLTINSNSDGFRSQREFGETDSRPRVLVVGDSFVFGSGVQASDRLTEVLESLQPGWRVDNMGMGGWGLDLMIRSIEHFADRIQPDVVVLAVYTDDFRRVTPYYAGVGYAIPKYELEHGELATVPYPSPERWQRSRIFQSLYQSYWQNRRVRDRYDLNGALLDRFIELSEEHGFKPVVMFLPGKKDTPSDKARRGFLHDWAQQSSVPYLDLTDPVHSAGVENTYIAGNFHWNARGHEIAAQELHRLLQGVFPELLQVRSESLN